MLQDDFAWWGHQITYGYGSMDIFSSSLQWAMSCALLFAYFFGITRRKPFKVVATHFLIILGVHCLLSITAIALMKSDAGELHTSALRNFASLLFSLLRYGLRLYIAILVVMLLNFFMALVQKGVGAMRVFHTEYNAANLDRRPLRMFLRYLPSIIIMYQALFLLGGVYMLWAVFFRMQLP